MPYRIWSLNMIKLTRLRIRKKRLADLTCWRYRCPVWSRLKRTWFIDLNESSSFPGSHGWGWKWLKRNKSAQRGFKVYSTVTECFQKVIITDPLFNTHFQDFIDLYLIFYSSIIFFNLRYSLADIDVWFFLQIDLSI